MSESSDRYGVSSVVIRSLSFDIGFVGLYEQVVFRLRPFVVIGGDRGVGREVAPDLPSSVAAGWRDRVVFTVRSWRSVIRSAAGERGRSVGAPQQRRAVRRYQPATTENGHSLTLPGSSQRPLTYRLSMIAAGTNVSRTSAAYSAPIPRSVAMLA